MTFFPVFLALKHKKILIIGGGDVACRKIDLLLKAKANITVVSPKLHSDLSQLVEKKQIHYIDQHYQSSQLDGFDQVWATTNSSTINHQIYHDANMLGILTNVVDDPQYCDFITPSMIDRDPIQVAISSGGASPVLVRYLRERLEINLPQNLGLLADYAGKQRQRIKSHFATVDERRRFWEQFFRTPQVEQATTHEQLETIFNHLLTTYNNEMIGSLYLIETGRDPELLSLKALRLMQQSDCILYHADVKPIFIDLCRRDAKRQQCDHTNIVEQVQQLLAQGMRVSVLATKDNHRPTLRKYCNAHSGMFIPMFG